MNSAGSIINISSGTTRFSHSGNSLYASMKGAVEVFTQHLAKELGAKNSGANFVAPGPVETAFYNVAMHNIPYMKTVLSSLPPLGSCGQCQ